MRKYPVVSTVVLFLSVVLLAGCGCQSVMPWWKPRDRIVIQGLEGRWRSETDKKIYDIAKGGPGEYVLTSRSSRSKEEPYLLTFAKIDHSIVVDITSPTFDTYRIGVHGVAQVYFHGNEASFLLFSDEAMEAALKKYHVSVLEPGDSGREVIVETSPLKLSRVLRYVLHPPNLAQRPKIFDKFQKIK